MSVEEENVNNLEDDLWESIYHSAKEDKQDKIDKFQELRRTYPQHILLGKGGVKNVYKSYDWKTKREIALAVPHETADNSNFDEFIHEAQILGHLEHPNIIPVYDTGYDEENKPYFTMKMVEGVDLAVHLKEKKRDSEFISQVPPLLDIFKQVCLAVSYAHSKNIIHHDIKPDNILIGKFGQVFLCDWGIALRSKNDTQPPLDLRIKGTPGFLAPEVLENKDGESLDIYSLGCLLYFILSGRVPIENKSNIEDYLKELISDNSIPLKDACKYDVPESLIRIYEKCCRPLPEDRYQSVSEIIEDIDLYSNGFATKAEHASFTRALVLMYRRNRLIVNVVLASLLTLFIFTLYYLNNLNETMTKLEETVEELKKSNQQVKKEKETTEKYAARVVEEEKVSQQYLISMRNAADSHFKDRPEDMIKYLEKVRSLSPEDVQTRFKLAKLYVSVLDWRKAKNAINDLTPIIPKYSKTLSDFVEKYSEQDINEDILYKMVLDSRKMSGIFQGIYTLLTTKLLNRNYSINKKADHIKTFFKLDTGAEGLIYDHEKQSMEIKGANIRNLNYLVYLNVKNLKFTECRFGSKELGLSNLHELDLRTSKVDKFNFIVDCSEMRAIYFPESFKSIHLINSTPGCTLFMPKAQLKKNFRSFKGTIKFYEDLQE